MDDMINRHDSIAEENIEPNGRPAKNQFEEWSSEVTDRADNVFKDDTNLYAQKTLLNKNYPVFPTIFISIFAENKPQNSKTYDRN